MRVLLVKTSSMGDLIHTFPALTDAGNAIPGIQFDWLVEKNFASIPTWHPLVNKVIPVALRKWRKHIFARETRAEWKQMLSQLRATNYDLIIDAQGLVKSGFVTYFAKGTRAGLDWSSAREALASLFYQKKYTVNFYQHAVVRMRSLFSLALGYPLPTEAPDFGLHREKFLASTHLQPAAAFFSKENAAHSLPMATEDYLVFLFGTTWTTKQWPEQYWRELATLAGAAGLRVKVSGGNQEEMACAERIAAGLSHVDVLPRLDIPGMASLLANAKAAVAVDTGFGHLAAALNVPTVSLYGPTNPAFTGALGAHSIQLAAQFPCAPCLSRTCTYREPSAVTPACYTTLTPTTVWETLQRIYKN